MVIVVTLAVSELVDSLVTVKVPLVGRLVGPGAMELAVLMLQLHVIVVGTAEDALPEPPVQVPVGTVQFSVVVELYHWWVVTVTWLVLHTVVISVVGGCRVTVTVEGGCRVTVSVCMSVAVTVLIAASDAWANST